MLSLWKLGSEYDLLYSLNHFCFHSFMSDQLPPKYFHYNFANIISPKYQQLFLLFLFNCLLDLNFQKLHHLSD